MGALVAKPSKSTYSFEFKLDIVRKVVDEGVTAEHLAHEYELSSGKLVRSWFGLIAGTVRRRCGPGRRGGLRAVLVRRWVASSAMCSG